VITLVLGGARSGKSVAGEVLAGSAAGAGGRVTYVATLVVSADDADLASRIAEHVRRRPPTWSTVEVPLGGDLASVLREVRGVALLDSLGPWVAGTVDLAVPAEDLVAALVERAERGDPTVVVSEEVGLGVDPTSGAGRSFRDVMGFLNQAVAAVASRSLLVVAGLVLPLGRLDTGWVPFGEP
jgi:adenosyl cobinamide kinase/adenosyl cobinamide phosphate guanylyltransferase